MTILKHVIHCKYSGLPLGTLEYATVAGHAPYISYWDKMVALHPIFSLPTHKRLAFVRSEWNRLGKQAADLETTDAENNLLRVGFLAVLHTLDSIKQEAASLPAMHIVQNNMSRLFALAYWHHYLDSKRFQFPNIKINRANANIGFDNIGDYLDLCFDIKADYETGVSEAVEKEKAEAAEKAMKALRNSWIIPVSNKQLWRWVSANLPEKYDADKEGWMATIFCGSENKILSFDKDELQLMEDIIISEMPAGNAILFAVRKRLEAIMQVYTDNKEAFTVDFDELSLEDSILEARATSSAPTSLEAPKMADFPTKMAFIKANALWYLQQRSVQVKQGGTL